MNESRQARSRMRHALAALALAGAGIPALAGTLPNPSHSTFCSVEGNTVRDPLGCEFGGGSGIPSYGFAVVEPATPFVRAEAESSAQAALGAGTSATLLYWFSVEGPASQQPVPLLMDVHLHAQGADDALAIAKIKVDTTVQPFAFIGEVCDGRTVAECNLPATLEQTIQVLARPGSTQDTVTLFAQAQAFVSRIGPQSAIAFADPHIYVDPSFAGAAMYQVVVSAGIGNAPLVPEPASLWLFGPGLLWLRWRMARDSQRRGP